VQKELRETFGMFGTGVIIACARKKNFVTETFFAKNLIKNLEDEQLIKKFEEFWLRFFSENMFGKKLKEHFFEHKTAEDFSGKNFLTKLKKLFSDEFFGMTINSFSSVSLNPPLISFCIDNKSANLPFFKKNRYFSLNILSQEQQDLASAFATPKNSAKWQVAPYFFGKFGNPIFQDSLAFIECKKHRVIAVGDHHVIIGEVVDFGKISNKAPLLYYQGKFSKLSNGS
jgi:flavin reductase (DIM6/NTAB) family NADH-FMN oxidoreductase RutF